MRAATAARPKEAWIPAAPPVVIGDGDAVATGEVPLDGAEIPVEATLVALVGDSVTVEKMTVGMQVLMVMVERETAGEVLTPATVVAVATVEVLA